MSFWWNPSWNLLITLQYLTSSAFWLSRKKVILPFLHSYAYTIFINIVILLFGNSNSCLYIRWNDFIINIIRLYLLMLMIPSMKLLTWFISMIFCVYYYLLPMVYFDLLLYIPLVNLCIWNVTSKLSHCLSLLIQPNKIP